MAGAAADKDAEEDQKKSNVQLELEAQLTKLDPLVEELTNLCLCNWVDDPESICDEMVIEAIQIDFPDWENKDGGCDRCIEVYELRAGV